MTTTGRGGAFYIKVRDGEYSETVPLGEIGGGAGVDIDSEGNVLGFEFLSFEEFVEVIERAGGNLEIPYRLTLPGLQLAEESLATFDWFRESIRPSSQKDQERSER